MITSTTIPQVRTVPGILEQSPDRLFVFAESRSGSTWLVNTLDTHPQIGLLDEVINPDYAKKLQPALPGNPNETPLTALQVMENQFSAKRGLYKGCKILFPQAIRFIDFYEFILNYRMARFIILTRSNSVRAEVSGLVANEHARWHLIEKSGIQPITVDPAFLYERLLWRKYAKEFCISMLRSHCPNILDIEYNQLFSGIEASLEKISKFLGISSGGFSYSSEVKANPFPLKDMVSNYTECLEYFSAHPFYRSSFEQEGLLE